MNSETFCQDLFSQSPLPFLAPSRGGSTVSAPLPGIKQEICICICPKSFATSSALARQEDCLRVTLNKILNLNPTQG